MFLREQFGPTIRSIEDHFPKTRKITPHLAKRATRSIFSLGLAESPPCFPTPFQAKRAMCRMSSEIRSNPKLYVIKCKNQDPHQCLQNSCRIRRKMRRKAILTSPAAQMFDYDQSSPNSPCCKYSGIPSKINDYRNRFPLIFGDHLVKIVPH